MSQFPLDLVIEGDPENLEWLRKQLECKLPEEALEPVNSQEADELREPILIGLIVALGGKAVINGGKEVLELLLRHREKMAELKLKYVYSDDTEEAINFDRLKKDEAAKDTKKK